MNWEMLQREIAGCRECTERWRGLVVDPLQIGEIPSPPVNVRILFVGVAPTNMSGRNKGAHFYSTSKDNLRSGLFKLLQRFIKNPLQGLSLEEGNEIFHQHNFFFVHAGKVRPVGQNAPPVESLLYCSGQHLKKEICSLNPKTICFLGKNNLAKVVQSFFGKEIGEKPMLVSLNGWKGWVTLAPQPLRGGEKRTALILKNLLDLTEG